MTFEQEIYKKINKGEKVYTFEQFLYNKLSPKKMRQCNYAYQKVLGWLKRDFCQGNLSSTVSYGVKKYINWLWENNKLKIESSYCNPHCRVLKLPELWFVLYYDGTIKNIKTKDIIKNPTKNKDGYCTYNGKLVHRLMAEAWFKNWDPKYEAKHKDKDRSNNNIENLELVDNQNNIKHRDGLPYEALPRYYTESKS